MTYDGVPEQPPPSLSSPVSGTSLRTRSLRMVCQEMTVETSRLRPYSTVGIYVRAMRYGPALRKENRSNSRLFISLRLNPIINSWRMPTAGGYEWWWIVTARNLSFVILESPSCHCKSKWNSKVNYKIKRIGWIQKLYLRLVNKENHQRWGLKGKVSWL